MVERNQIVGYLTIKPSNIMGASAPMSAVDEVYRKLVLLQTYLLRYGKGTTKDFRKIFDTSTERVQTIILKFAKRLEGVPVRSQQFRTITRQFAKEVAEERGGIWREVQNFSVDQMVEVADTIQTAVAGIVEGSLPVVVGVQLLPLNIVQSIVATSPFEGRTLREWVQNNKVVDVERIVRNAKIGMVNGENADQIARRVIGSSAVQYRDGQLAKAVRDMEAVYLTVMNGIGTQVRSAMYEKNKDIIKEETFVATLDDRTTLICASNDNKVFPLGEGPMPPLHFRCRSLRVVVFNVDNLSTRAAVPATEKMMLREFTDKHNLGLVSNYNDLPRGFKTKYNAYARQRLRELIGQVPASLKFEDWLKDQSKTFQDEYLGKAKAEIFREGKLTLSQFVTRDGYELTIEQLKQLSKRMGAKE